MPKRGWHALKHFRASVLKGVRDISFFGASKIARHKFSAPTKIAPLGGTVHDTMTTMTRMTTTHRRGHDGGTWTVAKARFSEMIDRALTDGPQIITRKGKKAVVVVSAEEWHGNTKRKGNFTELFTASPLRGSDRKIKRSKDGPRGIEL
jgi:prevent-host-death family protein